MAVRIWGESDIPLCFSLTSHHHRYPIHRIIPSDGKVEFLGHHQGADFVVGWTWKCFWHGKKKSNQKKFPGKKSAGFLCFIFKGRKKDSEILTRTCCGSNSCHSLDDPWGPDRLKSWHGHPRHKPQQQKNLVVAIKCEDAIPTPWVFSWHIFCITSLQGLQMRGVARRLETLRCCLGGTLWRFFHWDFPFFQIFQRLRSVVPEWRFHFFGICLELWEAHIKPIGPRNAWKYLLQITWIFGLVKDHLGFSFRTLGDYQNSTSQLLRDG